MRWLTAVALVVAATPAWAEEAGAALEGESRVAASRLSEARKLAEAKKWPGAVALWQAVIDGPGGDLVAAEPGRLVSARRVAHAGLARLPAQELERYRDKVEAQAKRWMAEGEGGLARVVEEAFCSRQAVAAADRLGDAAFFRGRFDEAEAWWRLIAPVTKGKPGQVELAYPDPPAQVAARLEAKQLLARLFRGDETNWAGALAAYRKRHPKAEGKLAGRSGPYAETLQALAESRSKRAGRMEKDWPTFGGATSRGRVASGPRPLLDHLSQLCRAGPTWRFDLEARGRSVGAGEAGKATVDAARRVAFYPVVIGDQALVADGRYVTAYDLRTGEASEWYDAARLVGGVQISTRLPASPDLRHTLTVAGGRVFARLGTPTVRDVRPQRGRPQVGTESILVSLSLRPGPDGDRRQWMVRAVDPGRKEHAVFEGAPVVQDGRVFIAASRFEGDRLVTAIHCYPSEPEDTSPVALWKVDVCSSRELLPASAQADQAAKRRWRHHLLTAAGPRVLYCSHNGAVVALDARTGARAWAFSYPRRDLSEPEDDPIYRDLAPPLFAGGRAYVAPADSDRAYCLRADTGEVVWERDGLGVVHLLGLGQGRLIFSTYRPAAAGLAAGGGLRAVMAANGEDEGGWALPDDGGGLLPFGRGLLVNDLVLWPTARSPYGVFAVNQADGLQPDNPSLLHRVPAGNLLLSDGRLLVTDGRYLHAFVPPEQLPDRVSRAPAGPREALRQAQVAVARGDTSQALERLKGARKANLSPAPGEVEREWARSLAEGARRGVETHDVAAAKKWESALIEEARGRPRVEALASVARSWEKAGDRVRARGAWEEIATRPRMAAELLGGARGQRAGRVALDEMARLGGPESDGLKRRWDRARPEDRPRVLGDLVRWFPAAAATRQALKEEAARSSQATAAQLWAQLLTLAVTGGEREAALAGLAQAWDRLGCPRAARLARGRLPDGHPAKGAKPPPPDEGPGKLFPLEGGVEVVLGRAESLLVARGLEGPGLRHMWCGAPGELVCRSRATGEVIWRRRLSLSPVWGMGVGTVLVVGGAQGLAAVDTLCGEVIWEITAPGGGPLGTRAEAEPLTAFAGEGDCCLAVQSGRWLIALDVLAGRVTWGRPTRAPVRLVWCGEGLAVVQAGSRLEFVHARSGQVLHSARAAEGRPPRDPVVAGHDVCVVPGPDEVICLSPSGERRWAFRPAGETTRTRDLPLVVPAGDSVLVVVPLNIGQQVHRLDRQTGRALWKEPLVVPEGPPLEGAWLVEKGAIYHAGARSLTRRRLTDGSVSWESSLSPGVGWCLKASGGAVMAWAAEAAAVRFSFRWPGGSLQWLVGPRRQEAAAVLCFDATAGTLVQRVKLTRGGLRSRVARPEAPPSLVPLAGVTEEPLAPTGLMVSLDARGLLVGQANRARSLSPPRSPK